jgi:hypothetical protein
MYDQLLLPNVDQDADESSRVEWRYNEAAAFNFAVIGTAEQAGGAWHEMKASFQILRFVIMFLYIFFKKNLSFVNYSFVFWRCQ